MVQEFSRADSLRCLALFNLLEIGDAGETLATAQAVGGNVTTIVGNIVRDNADPFSFHWNGGALTLDTVGSNADTQLFLFNSYCWEPRCLRWPVPGAG